MKTIGRCLLAVVILGSLWGCRKPTHFSNSTLTITPGVGIKGVIELGMTIPELARTSRDLVVHANDKPDYPLGEGWIWGFDIPSLGVSCGQMKEKAPLSAITFEVGEYKLKSPARILALPKFRGSVVTATGGKLSFHRAGVVKRQDVIAVLGQPEKLIDSRADCNRKGWLMDVGPTVASWLENEHSLEWLTTPSCSTIIYPKQGIGFALDSNGVYCLTVTRWTKQENVKQRN